jgi:sulfoxide reductase heme-binding subunit YedZ
VLFGDLAVPGMEVKTPVLQAASKQPGAVVVRSALGVGVVGVLVTLSLTCWVYQLQAQGRSAAALAMSKDMDMRDMSTYWAFPLLQASGLTGLLFAYCSAFLGLQQAGRAIARFPLNRQQIDRLHRHVSVLVVALVLVHMIATAFDAMGDTWETVLIPGTWAKQGWPQAVFGYNIGIVASYLLMLLAPTFYARRTIGPVRWRLLHRFVLLFYVLSIWHAMILGLDVAYYGWIRPAMWLAQIPLLLLFMRWLTPHVRSSAAGGIQNRLVKACCAVLFAVSAVTILAMLAIVITGRSGFIATV